MGAQTLFRLLSIIINMIPVESEISITYPCYIGNIAYLYLVHHNIQGKA